MTRVPASALLALLAAGCGSGGGDKPPPYDPAAIAAAAVKQLDANGNGVIDPDELDACPGLKAIVGEIDANADKKLSADELQARFARYGDGAAGGGRVAVGVNVTVDGAPAKDVTVRFEPEAFMGPGLKPAAGTTDGTGFANLKADGAADFGIPAGVYRIVATRAGKDLPAKYNTKTTLGREVFDGARASSGSVDLRLKSN